MKIPFFQSIRQYTAIKKEIQKAINRVLDSGWYVLGSEGKHFEQVFAKTMNSPFGIGVNSGTDALKIALRSLGVTEGDEVITVANTAVPTVSAIRETGAMPVFVDIDQYYTLDVTKLECAITSKTKVIIPVHLYGGVCDMKVIMKIARRHKLKVIEDCAQSTGATYHKKITGSWGDMSCFSFYPTKNLGALGDGGMIVTSHKKLDQTCKMLRMYGMEKGYYSKTDGYNSRLDEIQAAILTTKLPHLPEWNARRQEIASLYRAGITNPHIILPETRPGSTHVFHLFVIRTTHRQKLMEYLALHGIGCGIHYPYPIPEQSGYAYLKNQSKNLGVTKQVSKEILSLPIFPELKNSEISYIIKTLNNFSV